VQSHSNAPVTPTFAWLDHSEEQRRQMLDVLDPVRLEH